MDPETNGIQRYKPGFDIIIKSICDQFVNTKAKNQVNIAWETRNTLNQLVMDTSYFKEYHHYAHIFDDALIEIFQLNITLYKYRFMNYVKENGTKFQTPASWERM